MMYTCVWYACVCVWMSSTFVRRRKENCRDTCRKREWQRAENRHRKTFWSVSNILTISACGVRIWALSNCRYVIILCKSISCCLHAYTKWYMQILLTFAFAIAISGGSRYVCMQIGLAESVLPSCFEFVRKFQGISVQFFFSAEL